MHENPPRIPGQSCTNAVGGHFNPFNVDLSDQYSMECSPSSPLRCESGDLSGKHGKLSLSHGTASRKTYTFVDDNLNLWGPSAYSSESLTIIICLTGDVLCKDYLNKLYSNVYKESGLNVPHPDKSH